MITAAKHVRPKILCIDDDPAVPAAVQARLSIYDVECHSAFFGTHGIWLAVTEKPDLIVTDLRMSNGDGGYVVECLKSRDDVRAIPIIVLTGRRDPESERTMLMLGVQSFLHKPIHYERLMAELQKYVELRPLPTAETVD